MGFLRNKLNLKLPLSKHRGIVLQFLWSPVKRVGKISRKGQPEKKNKLLPPTSKIHHVNIQLDCVYIQYNNFTTGDDDVNMQQYDCVASWQKQIAYLVLWNSFSITRITLMKRIPKSDYSRSIKTKFLPPPS